MSKVITGLLVVITTSIPVSSQISPRSKDYGNVRWNTKLNLVDEVIRPGVSYTPSTGKNLSVFELNNKTLMGVFTSHEGQVTRFLSTSSGLLHVYRDDGSNIIEHHFVSKKKGVHSAQIEGHSFVYGHGKTYTVENRRSILEAEEVFNTRKKRSDPSDDEEVERAVDELRTDQDSRLLEQMAVALGEFGISGYKSPSARFFYMVARSVINFLPTNETSEDTISKNPTEEANGSEARYGRSSVSRRRRSWWWWRPEPSCQEYPNSDRECLGMCGLRCWCWRFVCGDCCYHQGCYEHDLCCDSDFWSWSCLFPTGFSCCSYEC